MNASDIDQRLADLLKRHQQLILSNDSKALTNNMQQIEYYKKLKSKFGRHSAPQSASPSLAQLQQQANSIGHYSTARPDNSLQEEEEMFKNSSLDEMHEQHSTACRTTPNLNYFQQQLQQQHKISIPQQNNHNYNSSVLETLPTTSSSFVSYPSLEAVDEGQQEQHVNNNCNTATRRWKQPSLAEFKPVLNQQSGAPPNNLFKQPSLPQTIVNSNNNVKPSSFSVSQSLQALMKRKLQAVKDILTTPKVTPNPSTITTVSPLEHTSPPAKQQKLVVPQQLQQLPIVENYFSIDNSADDEADKNATAMLQQLEEQVYKEDNDNSMVIDEDASDTTPTTPQSTTAPPLDLETMKSLYPEDANVNELLNQIQESENMIRITEHDRKEARSNLNQAVSQATHLNNLISQPLLVQNEEGIDAEVQQELQALEQEIAFEKEEESRASKLREVKVHNETGANSQKQKQEANGLLMETKYAHDIATLTEELKHLCREYRLKREEFIWELLCVSDRQFCDPSDTIVKQEHESDKIVQVYASGKRVIRGAPLSSSIRTIFPTGHVLIQYKNGDLKKIAKRQHIELYNKKHHMYQTCNNNRETVQYYLGANRASKSYADGTRLTIALNGSIILTVPQPKEPNNSEEDGMVSYYKEMKFASGVIQVKYADGRQEVINK